MIQKITLYSRSSYSTWRPDPTAGEYEWDEELNTWVRNASEKVNIEYESVPAIIATLTEVASQFINPDEAVLETYADEDSFGIDITLNGRRIARDQELKRIEAQIQKEEKAEIAKKQSIVEKAKATRARNKLLMQQDIQEFMNAHPELKIEPK